MGTEPEEINNNIGPGEGNDSIPNPENEIIPENDVKKKKSKKKKLIIVLICLLSLLLVVIVTAFFNKDKPDTEINLPEIGNGVINDGEIPSMGTDELLKYLKDKQDASKFTVQANSEVILKPDKKNFTLVVANSERNSIDVYLEFILDGKVIYKSPVLKPNQYVSSFTTDNVVKTDSDTIIARYNLLYEGKLIGVTEVELKLVH